MAKKITHIAYSGMGGITSFIDALIDNPSGKNYQHHIIFWGIEKIQELTLESFKEKGVECSFIQKKKGLDIKSFRKIKSTILGLGANHIFIHTSAAIPVLFFSSFLRKRSILFDHQANHLKSKKDWLFLRLGIVLSKGIVHLTLKQDQSKESQNHLYIPTIVNRHLFDSSSKQKKTKEELHFGSHGRLNELRDFTTLIKAFVQIKNTKLKLSIAGNGPQINELKELSKGDDRIIFLGELNYFETPKFLNSLDVYIKPSWGESQSVALLEAMSSHLPVIASDVKGINNVFDEEVLFYHSGDDNSLISAIEQMTVTITREEHSKFSQNYISAMNSASSIFDTIKDRFL